MLLESRSNALDVTEQCSRCYGAMLYRGMEHCSVRYRTVLRRVQSSVPYLQTDTKKGTQGGNLTFPLGIILSSNAAKAAGRRAKRGYRRVLRVIRCGG